MEEFIYDNNLPWPPQPDGTGAILHAHVLLLMSEEQAPPINAKRLALLLAIKVSHFTRLCGLWFSRRLAFRRYRCRRHTGF